MAHRNVRTRLAVLHHHGDDLVEMEETFRDRDEVPLDETVVVMTEALVAALPGAGD